MRLAWIALALLAQCTCSQPKPEPPVSPQTIWSELVDAGCVAQNINGPEAISFELEAGSYPWLSCLESGGSVKSCGAPCGPDAGK